MFQKFMNKKDFHPGSKWNIKRVWMAEQKRSAEEQRQSELTEQYQREQEKFENRQLVSKDEKLKLGLSFIYDAPPGFKDKNKDTDLEVLESKEEEEVKFEWLKGAPREGYTKDLNLETHAQPFGIPVRNVRCIKCHKWGHVNTDRECPLHNKSISTEPSSLTDASISDPLKLMQDMRNDGLALKQNALGRVLNKDDPNQQYLASDDDDDDDDPELAFLATLNEKQKRKLLRKLDKLENNKHVKKTKKKRKRDSSLSENEKKRKSKDEKRGKKKKVESDSPGSDSTDEYLAKKSKRKDNEKEKRNNKDLKYDNRKEERTNNRTDSSGIGENEKKYFKRNKTDNEGEERRSSEWRKKDSRTPERRRKRKDRE